MSQVKLCRDCRWHDSNERDRVSLRCINPEVNRKDEYALSSNKDFQGTSCTSERGRHGWFAACGMKGKQWEPRHD